MISHCCGRCGLPLDASHRRHVASVSAWVATCARCGFAVRWSARAAREPVRAWSRLRALNTRLGIAFGAAHAAALVLVGLSAHLATESVPLRIYARIGPVEQAQVLLPTVALGALAALLAATSALAFAPWRGVLARTACAWLVGVLPFYLVVATFLLVVEGLQSTTHGFWILLTKVRYASDFILPALAAVPIASLLLVLALAPLLRMTSRASARAHRRGLLAARRGIQLARHGLHAAAAT